MELWDLYDEYRQKTNKIIERDETNTTNLYRLVVHVCIFNSQGEMLIQQRHSTKKAWPNMWDITLGGSVKSGETSKQAAGRELSEELGINLDFTNERAFLTVNFDNGFDDYYLIKKDVNLNDIKFVDSEVQNVKWASKDEILQMIESNEFIEYYPSFIETLFEMRNGHGVHKQK